MFNVALFVLAFLAVAYSFKRDREKTKKALQIAYKSFANLLPAMLGIIGLLGLMLALVPGELIAGLFGNNSPLGVLLISLIGSVTLIPAFIAFPLASSLLAAGAGITFELLWFLASHPGRLYSREQLLQNVWDYDYLGDPRTVDTHIKRLREKLETWAKKRYIRTVWGLGYKFEVVE